MKAPNIRNERGWTGAICRDQAEGAIPNGTIIMKVNSEENDSTPNGLAGVVLGSVNVEDVEVPKGLRPSKYAYWVEWRLFRKRAVFIMDWKIARMPEL